MESPSQKTQKVKSTLYILDPHPIIAEGLKCIAAKDGEIQFIGASVESKTALAEIAKLKPDVVMLDISLKDYSGVELIHKIRQLGKEVKVLVYSMHDEKVYAERCLRAGAMGYLMKGESIPRVLQAIRQAASGGFFFSANLLNSIVSGGSARSGSRGEPGRMLSDRQLQVFEMVGRGFDSHEIAEKMELSAKTIDAHKANIRQKLGLASARELLMEALRWVER